MPVSYHHLRNMAKDSTGEAPSVPGGGLVGNPARGVKVAGAWLRLLEPVQPRDDRRSAAGSRPPVAGYPRTFAASGFAPKGPPDAGFGGGIRKRFPGAGLRPGGPRKGHISCISTPKAFRGFIG